jgi:acyl carrier protein
MNSKNISRDEVLESIRGAIMAQFPDRIVASQLTDEATRIIQDLTFDSLDLIELMLNIESTLEIEIPDDHFENFESEATIGQMADRVYALIATRDAQ